jgi:hypothetical protein
MDLDRTGEKALASGNTACITTAKARPSAGINNSLKFIAPPVKSLQILIVTNKTNMAEIKKIH